MAGLASVVSRFSQAYRKIDGAVFFGTIHPADEGVSNAMLSAKLVLRCLPAADVSPRDVILDQTGQRYLVAKLGVRPAYNTFRLFEINADLTLKRQTPVKDPLTGLMKGTKSSSLGTFPAMIERAGGDRVDGAVRVAEETRTVVTGARLQIGDIVDDAVVRWVIETLGVTYGEVR